MVLDSQKKLSPLTYDSCININLTEFPKTFIYSDGFNQSSLTIKSFKKYKGNRFQDFNNTVFKIIPALDFKSEQKVLKEVLTDFLQGNIQYGDEEQDENDEFPEINLNQQSQNLDFSNEADLHTRKSKIQSLQQNLDGEINSNMNIYNKLKGTEILFETSNFHLLHLASLKFLSIDDENTEQIKMKLEDFPSESCLFKFFPCLKFQQQRTKIVYDQDVLNICSSRTILNRKPYLFTSYQGIHGSAIMKEEEKQDTFQEENKDHLVQANIQKSVRWTIHIFSQSEQIQEQKNNDKNNNEINENQKYISVGDSIWLNLSERSYCLSGQTLQDPFQPLIENIKSGKPLIQKQQRMFYGQNTQQSNNKESMNNSQQHLETSNVSSNKQNQKNSKIQQSENKIPIYAQFNQRENQLSQDNLGQHEDDFKNEDQDQFQYIKEQLNHLEIEYVEISDQTKKNIYRPNTNALWKVERETISQGGKITWDGKYRLRHFSTGKYLCALKSGNRFYLTLSEEVEEHDRQRSTLFQFESCQLGEQNNQKEKQQYVSKDTFYRIKNAHFKNYVSFRDETLEENDHHHKQPILEDQKTAINTFKMHKAGFEDTWETNYLLYQLPILMTTLKLIGDQKAKLEQTNNEIQQLEEKTNKQNTIKNQFIKILQTLNQIEEFVCNKLTSNISVSQEFAIPNSIRQHIIREQNLLGILCWLLYKSFPTPEEFKQHPLNGYEAYKKLITTENNYYGQQKYKQHKKQTKLSRAKEDFAQYRYALCYKIYILLSSICHQNSINQEYVFSFISLLSPQIGYGKFVADQLIKCFSQNENILKRFQQEDISMVKHFQNYQFNPSILRQDDESKKIEVTFLQDLIKKFYLFPTYSKPELLKFISICCGNKDKAIHVNQDVVNKSLQDADIVKKGFMEIRQQQNEGQGTVLAIQFKAQGGDRQFLTLAQFFDQDHQDANDHYKQDLSYLKEQLNLYANICMERNYANRQIIEPVFPIETLVAYILDEKIDDEKLRAQFSKLIRNVYIDTEKRNTIQYPNLVRTLKDMDKGSNDPKNIKQIVFTKKLIGNMRLLKNDKQNQQNNQITDSQSNLFSKGTPQHEYQVLTTLKKELLKYFEKKYNLVKGRHNLQVGGQVFNALTLENIKILFKMLQTGLFHHNTYTDDDQNGDEAKQGSAKTFSNLMGIKKEKSDKKQTEVEKLLCYLIQILEFDKQYMTAMSNLKLKMKYEEDIEKAQNQNKMGNIFKSGITGITNVGSGFTSMITTDSKASKKSKVKSQAVNLASIDDFENERIIDPLFKKVKGLKKILLKYNNKTFTVKDENSQQYEYEVQIKIEICKILSLILDQRQDFLIDNMISYFQDNILTLPKDEFQKYSLDDYIENIFPEGLIEIGTEFDSQKSKFQIYTQSFNIKSFDETLERPFIESLLLSFFFSFDGELENNIIGLVRRCVCQKKELFSNIMNLEILFSQETQQAEHGILGLSLKIQQMVHISQSWLSIDDNNSNTKEIDEIIKHLRKLDDILSRDVQYELQKLKTKQSIFSHKGTHEIIFQLLDKSMALVQNNKTIFSNLTIDQGQNLDWEKDKDYNEMNNVQSAQKIIQLFKVCFSILSNFCYNNQENQQILYKTYFKSLQAFTYVNIGQISFLSKIIKNNYDLCVTVSKSDLQFFVQMISQHGKREEFLNIFSILLECAETKKQTQVIQKKVLDVIFGDLNSETIQEINPFAQNQKHNFYSQFYPEQEEPDNYKSEFTIILSKALQTDLEVNMIMKTSKHLKVKNLIQYLLLKTSMDKPDISAIHQQNVSVRIAICDILLLFLSKNLKDGMTDFLHNIQQFSQILEQHKQDLDREKKLSYELKYYLIDKLIPLVNIYSYHQQKDTSIEFSLSYKNKIIEFADTFIKNLEFIYRDQNEIFSSEFRCKQLTQLARLHQLTLPESYSKNNNVDINFQMDLSLQDSDQFNGYFEQNLLQEMDKQQNNKQKNKKSKDQGQQNEFNSKHNHNDTQQSPQQKKQEYWEKFKEKMQESDQLKTLMKQEVKILSSSMMNIPKMFMSDLKPNQKDILLSSEDIILKLINFIEQYKTKNISKQNVIFTLRTLCDIVKKKDDEEDDEGMIQRQEMMDKLNATKISLILLWEDQENNAEYLFYLIKFTILLLEGGNPTVQKTCYDFFLTSASCERFFEKIQFLIDAQINEISTGHQILEGNKVEKITLKLLRLLQLFCEGHNIDLQNYLSNQKNSKKSIDLVSKVIELLSSYKISNETYDTISQCFDTLTEVIQGPCLLNQKSIANSKFLQYAVLVLSEDEKIFELKVGKQKNNEIEQNKKFMENQVDQNAQDQNQLTIKDTEKEKKVKIIEDDINPEDQKRARLQIHRGRLGRLKFKCLITLVSLLECNDPKTQLIKQIMRTVPLSVLTNNLARIYELYQRYQKEGYVEEIFDQAEEEIDETEENHDPEEKELIIENGFLIYTLVNMYLENNKGQEEEDEEMNEFLNEFKREQKKGGLFGKDNIFGQLAGLGEGLVKAGMSTVNKVKDKIVNTLSKEEKEQQAKEQRKKQTKEAIKFFKENSAQIEIVRDKKLQTIIFPILPFCKELKDDIKENFNENVVRTSTKSKLENLMKESDKIIKTMKHEEVLRRLYIQNSLLGFLAKHSKLWENLAFACALTINIIILISYQQNDVLIHEQATKDNIPEDEQNLDNEDYEEIVNYYRKREPRLLNNAEYPALPVINVLAYITMGFLSVVLLFFLLKRAPLLIKDTWKGFFQTEMGIFKRFFLIIVKLFKSLFLCLTDFDIMYNLGYMATVILGRIIHPFLFAFSLTDFLRTGDLKNVVKAVYNPRVELTLSFILFLVIEYYFTIFAFIFYSDHYDEGFCKKMWKCYIKTFDYTFKETGALGAFLHDNEDPLAFDDDYAGIDHSKTGLFIGRWIFDNLFNISLVLVMVNIVGGIIIDTFRSLRELYNQRLEDQTQICFICGFSREKLDKSLDADQGFYYHIKQVHYMWNYIHYKAYLQQKESTEFNGNESYIWDKIEAADLGWFPIKRTRNIKEENEEEDEKLIKTTELLKQMTVLNQKLDSMSQRIQTLDSHTKG